MRKQPAPHQCSIVPPYLLEALAASDDPGVAAWARATLVADEDLRLAVVAVREVEQGAHLVEVGLGVLGGVVAGP